MRGREGRGFTLIELLVVVSLMALITGTVGATFAGGVRVWERLQAHGTHAQWVALAFDQFRRDVRNLRQFTPIPLEGDYDTLSFPSVVPFGTVGEMDVEEIGRIGYFFDSTRQQLCRSLQPYRLLRRVRVRDACAPVLTQVERLRFSYYGVQPGDQTLGWSDAWSSKQPPMAVKLEVRYVEPANQQRRTESLVVPLSVALRPPAGPS